MRVLVTGGRNYSDKQHLFSTLSDIHLGSGITHLIHGDATGADTLASEWAAEHRVTTKAMAADWVAFGKAAGPIRNSEMLKEKPDLVIAFPGGVGTRNMVKQASDSGVKVRFV